MKEQRRVPVAMDAKAEGEMLERAGLAALAKRRASGQIFTYELDGWVVQEHPGGVIERLAPADEFKAANFPFPGFVEPKR